MLDPRLKASYISKMLPHVLSKRAKMMGIQQTNKSEWKSLAKKIKAELLSRFDSITEIEYFEDMSFNHKAMPEPALEINYQINDRLIDNAEWIPCYKKQSLKKIRLDLLNRSIAAERKLALYLDNNGIKTFQKIPFYIKGHYHFANIYLPDFRTVIEIVGQNELKYPSRRISTAIHALRSLGFKVMIVTKEDINGDKFQNNILNHISSKR